MREFPSPLEADEDGLLAVSLDCGQDLMVKAYQNGIFPWPMSEDPTQPIPWFSPDPRGVITQEGAKSPKRFLRELKGLSYELRLNADPQKSLELCSQAHSHRSEETWINQTLMQGYLSLLPYNFYVLEAFIQGKLAGLIFGTCFGKIVNAESMCFFQKNGSKIVLHELINLMRKFDLPFIDVQTLAPTPLLFGAEAMDRESFVKSTQKLSQEPFCFVTAVQSEISKTY